MGKKNAGKAHGKQNITQEPKQLAKQKRQELHKLVEKLLKSTSVAPDGPGPAKLWELYEDSQTIIDRIQQIESEIKSPVNAYCRSVSLDKFLSWMKRHDSKFEGVTVSEFPGYDFGLQATKPITKDSVVLEIPKKLMFSEQSCDDEEFKNLLKTDRILANMPNVALAFALIVERLNVESFWKPYFDVLPQYYRTILYYKPHDLQELKGSPSLEMALKQIRSIQRQYAYFYKMIWNAPFKLVDRLKEKWTYDLYCWAVSTVMTRQNHVPLGEDCAAIPALIPLWDMANYEKGRITTEYNMEEHRLEYSSLDDYAVGDQIFIFYGERSNAELLVHSGFVYMDNPHDTVSIRLGISPSDPLYQEKESVLSALSLPRGWDLPLARLPVPLTPQLLGYVRVFNMNKEQLDHWLSSEHVTDLFHIDCALDHELEKKTWTFLLTRLQILLSVYPTTAEADRLALAEREPGSETKSTNNNAATMNKFKKSAVKLRLAEKQILQDAIDYVKQRMCT